MKTLRFYVLENSAGDCYVAPEDRLKKYVRTADGLALAVAEGKPVAGEPVTRKVWHEELGGLGKWLCLSLRPSTTRIEKQINARCRVDHMLTGLQVDKEALPAARFEEIVTSWGHEDLEKGEIVELKTPVSAEAYLDLHPNLSESIDEALKRHLRPNMEDDPDFLQRLRARSTASSEES